MGASNVIAAYTLYAGRVPPLAMQCLAYMAVVSRDADEHPWFGQGHEALAVHAMGRPEPASASDLRAVRRAVQPLLDAGAVEADRRAAPRRNGPSTVRYRLNLVGRIPSCDHPVDNSPDDPDGGTQRRTDSVQNVGRFVAQRRTVSDRTQDGFRPTEEEEDQEERGEEEGVTYPTQVPTAREDPEPEPESPVKCLHGLSAATRPDGKPSCTFCRRALEQAS